MATRRRRFGTGRRARKPVPQRDPERARRVSRVVPLPNGNRDARSDRPAGARTLSAAGRPGHPSTNSTKLSRHVVRLRIACAGCADESTAGAAQRSRSTAVMCDQPLGCAPATLLGLSVAACRHSPPVQSLPASDCSRLLLQRQASSGYQYARGKSLRPAETWSDCMSAWRSCTASYRCSRSSTPISLSTTSISFDSWLTI